VYHYVTHPLRLSACLLVAVYNYRTRTRTLPITCIPEINLGESALGFISVWMNIEWAVIVRGYVDVLRTGGHVREPWLWYYAKVFWKVAEWMQLTEKARAHFPDESFSWAHLHKEYASYKTRGIRSSRPTNLEIIIDESSFLFRVDSGDMHARENPYFATAHGFLHLPSSSLTFVAEKEPVIQVTRKLSFWKHRT